MGLVREHYSGRHERGKVGGGVDSDNLPFTSRNARLNEARLLWAR